MEGTGIEHTHGSNGLNSRISLEASGQYTIFEGHLQPLWLDCARDYCVPDIVSL